MGLANILISYPPRVFKGYLGTIHTLREGMSMYFSVNQACKHATYAYIHYL